MIAQNIVDFGAPALWEFSGAGGGGARVSAFT